MQSKIPTIKLKDIPGIGEKTANRFIEHFGTEENAIEAIIDADIASISLIEGVGYKYAIALINEVNSKIQGVSTYSFLKTNEAIGIYEKLLDIIKSFAHTNYAKDKIHTFFPYPVTYKDKIKKRQEYIYKYIEHVDVLRTNKEFIKLLGEVKPFNNKIKNIKIRDRAIITSESKKLEKIKELFGEYIDIHFISNLSEVVDIARGYSHVLATDDDLFSYDLPEDIELEIINDLETCELWKVIPENEINIVAHNLKVIENSIELTEIIRSSGMIFLETLKPEILQKLKITISALNSDGDIKSTIDPEIDRLTHIFNNIDSAIDSVVVLTNAQLIDHLKEHQLTLNGHEMIKMIQEGTELKSLLENQLYTNYIDIINQTKKNICEVLSLQKKEILVLDILFPSSISYPIEIDKNQLTLFKNQLKERIDKLKMQHKREVAHSLVESKDTISLLIKEVLSFDIGFTISCFAAAHNLTLPNFIEESGIGFEKAENLFIKSRHGSVVPINYEIGVSSFNFTEQNNKIVLLSGVNSGGKTSLLELVAQCIILAHMGFPVPAKKMEIGLTEGLYYFGKSKGTLDAGAFETTLIDFSMVSNDSNKVVLVDELESITEPGASAKIIAGILEMLAENESSLAIFVSHLSDLILENTVSDMIRVDGIEASGLDANLNLIVDRTPRYNYTARSTPELIVERLLRKTTGTEFEFYKKLKSKFN